MQGSSPCVHLGKAETAGLVPAASFWNNKQRLFIRNFVIFSILKKIRDEINQMVDVLTLIRSFVIHILSKVDQ
jgi:hypothetical protein